MMKILRVDLLDAVMDAANAIKPSVIPIMEGIKLEIINGRLEVSGSSPVLTIKRYIPVNDPGDFKPVVVNMKFLLRFLSKVTADNIILLKKNNELLITCGRLKCRLPLLDVSKWLELDKIDVPEYESYVLAEEFQKNIGACLHAVGFKSNNRLMEAVYMNFGKGFSASAVDGHRISIRDDCFTKEFSLLIDGGIMKELVKILSGNIKVAVKDHIACFSDTVTTIYVSQTSGNYFNLVPLISSTVNSRVKFDRNELIEALEAVTIIKNIVVIEIINNSVVINSQESSGDITAELDVVNNGDDLKIAVNSSYLMDALKSLREDAVTLEFNGKTSPIIIHENTATELVLPINLK